MVVAASVLLKLPPPEVNAGGGWEEDDKIEVGKPGWEEITGCRAAAAAAAAATPEFRCSDPNPMRDNSVGEPAFPRLDVLLVFAVFAVPAPVLLPGRCMECRELSEDEVEGAPVEER